MLVGDKVRLRALEKEDERRAIEWLNDPEVRQGLLVTDPMAQSEAEAWHRRYVESGDKIFAIEMRARKGWAHVGNVGMHRINWKDRSATVGVMIGERSCWGRGLASDAIRTVVRFAFEELGLHRLELDVFDFNDRAIRCYERAGFSREGTKREALFRGGRFHDVHVMALLATDIDPPVGRSGHIPARKRPKRRKALP